MRPTIARPPRTPRSALACAMLALGVPRAQPIVPPAPPAEIALPTGITVRAQDYFAHLYAHLGSARLRELLLDRVLEKEAAGVDLALVDPTVARALRDPDAHARQLVRQRIEAQHRGDRAAFAAALAASGVTVQEDLWATRLEGLRQAHIAALVQSRRTPDPARLRRLFDEHYGVDGLRVRVRHVFQSFGAERHKVRAANATITDAELEEVVRKRVAALMVLHERGTPFHLLVARGSEDPAGRALALDPARQNEAGWIEGYNFQHFGAEFAEVVRTMQPGEVRGPVRTSHGYHIILLESVTRTVFADVQPELQRLLRADPPSLHEQRELIETLVAAHGIDAALRR